MSDSIPQRDIMWESYQVKQTSQKGRQIMLQSATIFTLPFEGRVGVFAQVDNWPWPRIVMGREEALKLCHIYPLDVIVTLEHGVSIWVRISSKNLLVDSEGKDTGLVEFFTEPIPESHEPMVGWDFFSGG